ncbi:MAG TPA: hypothetical protein VIG70_06050 [Burkholderiales bacterium]
MISASDVFAAANVASNSSGKDATRTCSSIPSERAELVHGVGE